MLPYIKPYWARAILATLVTVPVGTMDAIIALTLKSYMDVIMVQKDISLCTYIPILITTFSLAQSGFNYLSTYLNAWVGMKLSSSLKFSLYEKLMRYDTSFFDKSSSGQIQTRFNTDVDSACNGLLNHTKSFVTRIFSSLSLMLVLIWNSWQLSIVAILVFPVSISLIRRIRKKIRNISSATVSSSSNIITYYIEAFNGNKVISSYNLYCYQLKKLAEALNTAFFLGIKMIQRTGILSPVLHFVTSIGIAVIVWLGSYLIVNEKLTMGGFVSFITALLLLYQPIKAMGYEFSAMQSSFMAMERIFNLLRSTSEILNHPNAKKLEKISNEIRYEDVNFEYVKNRSVLTGISFEVKKGETVALVGNSGGGKTTIVNLLPRFYELSSGKILIDGIDTKYLDLDSLRSKIAIVFQDNFLFSGTIMDNILLGEESYSQEKIDSILKLACLDEFVGSLDMGLDTQIGERGMLLSGGQKQRIAIARAFLKDAPILILDEATSALDNKSEAVIQKAIDNLMKDRTVFVVAHRLSTIRNADKIVVVNGGKIVEIGKHEELIENEKGEYYSLYHGQLSGTN
jgi:subfamily B ATP-binding cassette protein MsbA